jgi:hypothetical protein
LAIAQRAPAFLIAEGELLMRPGHLVLLTLGIVLPLLAAPASDAANPFLSAADEKPVSAKFRGAEWGDEIAQEEIGLSVRVITTRVAKMAWGEIYKIAFADIASRAQKRRMITPEYFIVTDDRILLLNEANIPEAIRKTAALEKPPEVEPSAVYGITEGKFEYSDGPWQTTIELKDDLCIYHANHDSSGHFKKMVWKKGVGLLEYSMGYGAAADGFRLKRVRTG